MKKLFQYAVTLHEYEEKDGSKEYKDSRIILEPKFTGRRTKVSDHSHNNLAQSNVFIDTKEDFQRAVKNRKITYNPKGIKRVENSTPKAVLPKQDLSQNNIIIKTDKDHYWRIDKKK